MLSTMQIFRNILPRLWLRPERALWDAYELGAVSKILLPNLKGPSMDYGSTDGLNTFAMLGGELGPEYDEYMDIPDDQLKDGCPAGGDLFGAMPGDVQLPILSAPVMQFDLGLSWKLAHLKRAARLGIYKAVELMQLNEIDGEKFGRFQTIWAPQLFWTNNEFITDKLLDFHSMLDKGGNLITVLPTVNQKSEDIFLGMKLPSEAYEILDRGISNNLCKNAKSLQGWEQEFDKANLVAVEQVGFIDPICGGFYQLGFRPMLVPLLKMHSILRKKSMKDFMELKNAWIDVIHQYINPLVNLNDSKIPLGGHLWAAYRLQRKDDI